MHPRKNPWCMTAKNENFEQFFDFFVPLFNLVLQSAYNYYHSFSNTLHYLSNILPSSPSSLARDVKSLSLQPCRHLIVPAVEHMDEFHRLIAILLAVFF